MKIKRLEKHIEVMDEHDIPYEVLPPLEEIIEKVNEIIDYLNRHEFTVEIIKDYHAK